MEAVNLPAQINSQEEFMPAGGGHGQAAPWGGTHWGLLPALGVLPFFAASGQAGPALWVPWLACLMASYDLAQRRIPNPLNALAALMGLAWSLSNGGLAGLGQGLLGGLVGFGLLAIFFFMGAVGAGDVKALAALGTFLTPWGALGLFLYTVLAGGVLALLRLALAQRSLGPGGWRLWASRTRGLEMPYGLAIACGALVHSLTGGMA